MIKISNYPDYKLTKEGKVYSFKFNENGKELKGSVNNKGYLTVSLSSYGNSKSFLVHRLIAEHFLPNLSNYNQVNHIDGNKLNNDVSNLEWCTQSQNMIHAVKNGKHDSSVGENSNLSKLNSKQVRIIKRLLSESNLTQQEIADTFGVKRSTVKEINCGRSWKHIEL